MTRLVRQEERPAEAAEAATDINALLALLVLDALSPRADGAVRLRALVAAALADDGGQALQQALRQA